MKKAILKDLNSVQKAIDTHGALTPSLGAKLQRLNMIAKHQGMKIERNLDGIWIESPELSRSFADPSK